MSIFPRRYCSLCLASLQCPQIGAKLYIVSMLIENAIFGRIQYARYTSALLTLRYNTSRPNSFSLSSLKWNELLFTSCNQITIRELNGCDLSLWKRFKTFLVYVNLWINIPFGTCLICKLRHNFVFPRSFSSKIFFNNFLFL